MAQTRHRLLLRPIALSLALGLLFSIGVALLWAWLGIVDGRTAAAFHVSLNPPRVGVLSRSTGLRVERLTGRVTGPWQEHTASRQLEALRLHQAGLPTAATSRLESGCGPSPRWARTGPPDPARDPRYQDGNIWQVWGAGWPFASLRMSRPDHSTIPLSLLTFGHRESAFTRFDLLELPHDELINLRPYWPGLMLNTIVTAIPIYMLALLALWLRAVRRRHRGRCPRCSYDLQGELARGCPECGWRRLAFGTSEPAEPDTAATR